MFELSFLSINISQIIVALEVKRYDYYVEQV